MNQIEIYQTANNETQIDVTFEQDTVWLTQAQMVELFKSSKANISEHLKSIFTSGELDTVSTVRKFRTVRQEGKRKVSRDVEHYNLDVIISLGYRVNSRTGVKFRQWATQRLKEHLVQGYTINQKRLEQLQKVVNIIQQSGDTSELTSSEAKGLLEIITNYTQSFILLNQYDSNDLVGESLNETITYEIEYEEAISTIEELKSQLIQKKQASALFGNRKDDSFKGLLGNIVQTFGGEYLYKSIEEQATHL